MLGTNTRTSGLDAYTDSVRRLAQQSKEMALIFEAFRDGERVGHTPSQIASTVE